jgi:hypothetical protein
MAKSRAPLSATWLRLTASGRPRMRLRLRSLAIVDTRGFVGRRHGLPQIEQPLRPEIVFELEDRWKIAPQLLSQAICQSIALSAEILGDARPLTPFRQGRRPRAAGKQRGSVRKAEAITSASRLSSLAPARVNRSRKRSICFGLMACTLNPRSISVSTRGRAAPRSRLGFWTPRPRRLSPSGQAAISASPSPLCSNTLSPFSTIHRP